MTTQPEQPQVGPQPCAQQVAVQVVQGGGQSFVVLHITGPTGSYVSFLDPDAAAAVAAQLEQAATHAKTGLVVASGLAGLNGHAQR